MGIILGDIVSDDLILYLVINRVIMLLGVLWFYVLGNYDFDFDVVSDEYLLDSWCNFYGLDIYVVEEGGVSFVFFDDVVYDFNVRLKYVGGLCED